MGAVTQVLMKQGVQVRGSQANAHWTKAPWSSLTRPWLSGSLGIGMPRGWRLPEGEQSTEWVARMPSVVAALNGEITQLTGKRLSDGIKAKFWVQIPLLWQHVVPVILE